MIRVNPDLAWTSKPWQICLCKDGTLTCKLRGAQSFNSTALPVYACDSEAEAKNLIILLGKAQYGQHPRLPGQTWYRLSDFSGEVGDLPAVTERFREAAAWILERSAGRKERVVA